MNANRQRLIRKLAERRGLGDLSPEAVDQLGRQMEAKYLHCLLDGRDFVKEGRVVPNDGETQPD